MGVVVKRDIGTFENAAPFYVDNFRGVNQNVRDGWIGEQRLERSQAKDLIKNLSSDFLAFRQSQRGVFALQHFADDLGNLVASRLFPKPVKVLKLYLIKDFCVKFCF